MTPFTKIAVLLLLAVTVSGVMYFFYSMSAEKELPVLGDPGRERGTFSFVSQDGERITEQSITNKIVVAEYFFTSCPGICKQMSKNLQKVHKQFVSDHNVLILSHTADPAHDSVPVLKAYANKLGADSQGWKFLTGTREELYNTAQRFYLLSAEEQKVGDEIEFIHTQYVCLLDPLKRIRGFYDATDEKSIELLINDINKLKRASL